VAPSGRRAMYGSVGRLRVARRELYYAFFRSKIAAMSNAIAIEDQGSVRGLEWETGNGASDNIFCMELGDG